MSAPYLTLGLLAAGCFSLATWVDPRIEQPDRRHDDSPLAKTLGDSRRLLANHFFTRSDVYFHSGYYPSIFEQAGKKENHLAASASAPDHNPPHGEAGHVHHDGEDGAEPAHGEPGHVCDGHDDEEHSFLGKPKDWMDGFSRNFFVSKHTHLTEKGTNAPKEILPWLKLSAELNPQLTESYTVGAYWLRQLHKDAEAEQFLREGLRRNPRSYQIMLELGKGYFDRADYDRARNVLEMAMQHWREQENPKLPDERDKFSAAQIVNYLARVEDRTSHRERAISWLELLKKLSPHPEQVDKRIAEIRAGKPLEAH